VYRPKWLGRAGPDRHSTHGGPYVDIADANARRHEAGLVGTGNPGYLDRCGALADHGDGWRRRSGEGFCGLSALAEHCAANTFCTHGQPTLY
jgi:hypothetical protein